MQDFQDRETVPPSAQGRYFHGSQFAMVIYGLISSVNRVRLGLHMETDLKRSTYNPQSVLELFLSITEPTVPKEKPKEIDMRTKVP